MEHVFNGLIICLWGLLLFIIGAVLVGILLIILNCIIKGIKAIYRTYKDVKDELEEDFDKELEKEINDLK